jgi:hypothetical protein
VEKESYWLESLRPAFESALLPYKKCNEKAISTAGGGQ